MKTSILLLKKASIHIVLGVSSILLASCGSYQNSSYYDNDGIYGGSQAQRNEVVQNSNANNYYGDYFNSLQYDPQSDQIFTDIDSYNNYNSNQNSDDQYAGWGSNHASTDINIYSNNMGIGYGWGFNSPYYGWGYNNFGWNNPYIGFNNFGWNSPYYGWGYGFNTFGWNQPFYGYGGFNYGYNNSYYYNNNNFYNRVRSSSYSGRETPNTINSRSTINSNNNSIRSSSTTNRRYSTPSTNSSRENTSTRSYNTESNNYNKESSTPSRNYSSPSSNNNSYSRPSSSNSSSGGSTGSSGSSGRRGR